MQLAMTAAVPLWQGITVVDDRLAERLTSYSHDIAADGGYKKATIALAVDTDEAEQWLEHGIGRHIVVKNHGLDTIWEGFVNTVEASIGSLAITIGPLLDVATKVRVDYKTISYATNPPIGGEQATTGFGNNTNAQRRYGVLETIVSAGEVRQQQADQIQQVYLNQWSTPSTTQRLSLGSEGSISLTLGCAGYYDMLGKFYVDRTLQLGLQNFSDKIADAIAQDPNGIFIPTMASIQENTAQIGAAEDGTRTAMTVIKEVVSAGDNGGNRYVFGMYGGRLPKYEKIPDRVEYTINVKQPPQIVRDMANSEVEYWNVKPGRWLWMKDLVVGSGRMPVGAQELSRDIRAMFIESVSFSSPHTLTINGGKVGTLSQIMARQGLGGI